MRGKPLLGFHDIEGPQLSAISKWIEILDLPQHTPKCQFFYRVCEDYMPLYVF